jgi:crotonobetainyl-CoA:carnitine CoA-transferase CaiB-like acyl-CoA transferase
MTSAGWDDRDGGPPASNRDVQRPAHAGDSPAVGPLSGVTVVDLGQVYNGPYCTFLMAMAGARVIKIEPPGGENLRRRAQVGGAAVPFAMLNSNKRFATLNLKSADGRALLLSMVERADVLVENFAPGVVDRLGIGWDTLKGINPRLVYASGSGYGSTGPMKGYPAMDITVQAMSGLMSINGFADRPPVKVGPAICDFTAGVHLYAAIVSALFARERTGRGDRVEASMMESVYPTLASNLGLLLGSNGAVPTRTGNRHGGLSEAPYNVYPTTDGFVAVISASDAKWERLLEAIGRSELKGDTRYATLRARVANIDEVDEIVAGFTRVRTRAQAFETLAAAGITCAPVRDLAEVVDDAHMHQRGALERVKHPTLGEVVLNRSALRFESAPLPQIEPSGETGRDNAAIYRDWLGVEADRFEALRAGGII